MATERHHGAAIQAEGEWFIELEKGWTPWIIAGSPFHGIADQPFRYTHGKTEFEAQFQSETEGIQMNLSTGKVRPLRKLMQPPVSSLEGLDSQMMYQHTPVAKRSEAVTSQTARAVARPSAAKVETVPTCYFLGASGAQSYEGEYEWLIELEKGWSPWMPENQPFQGNTDEPLRYTLGRYDFEVNFESETHGTQTNLVTGKVRRIQRKHKSEPMPAWEGTGVRRREASGVSSELPVAPANSAANAAQARRAERRAVGGYRGAVSSPTQKNHNRVLATERPRVSQSAQEGGSATIPHYMRGLKSKTQQ